MARDILNLELILTPNQFMKFSEMVGQGDVEAFADRLDRHMFGTQGSLAKSIESGAREPNTFFDRKVFQRTGTWKNLTRPYLNWKRNRMADGQPIPGEAPPNTVISEKIWIRTGKVKQCVETIGNGAFKTMRTFWQNFMTNRPFVEWFIKGADYWKFANERRSLFHFTQDDKTVCNGIFYDWAMGIVARNFGSGSTVAQPATAGAMKAARDLKVGKRGGIFTISKSGRKVYQKR